MLVVGASNSESLTNAIVEASNKVRAPDGVYSAMMWIAVGAACYVQYVYTGKGIEVDAKTGKIVIIQQQTVVVYAPIQVTVQPVGFPTLH